MIFAGGCPLLSLFFHWVGRGLPERTDRQNRELLEWSIESAAGDGLPTWQVHSSSSTSGSHRKPL